MDRIDLLIKMAQKAVATEVATFASHGASDISGFKLVDHIRPGSSSEERAAAVAAFRELAKPCVDRVKDGVIRIEGTKSDEGYQYCLVVIANQGKALAGVVALIARCRNTENATKRLKAVKSEMKGWEWEIF